MHFHENHATTLSEHHIFKKKGITENKVDYVYVMICSWLCKSISTGSRYFSCRWYMKRKHLTFNVRFAGNLKSIKHEH